GRGQRRPPGPALAPPGERLRRLADRRDRRHPEADPIGEREHQPRLPAEPRPVREVRIGLIGTGKMARAHSQAYLTAARFFDLPVRPVLAVLCGRARERAEPLASAFGWGE